MKEYHVILLNHVMTDHHQLLQNREVANQQLPTNIS